MKSLPTYDSYLTKPSGNEILSKRIYLQLAIYLFGFILLIGLQLGFSNLTKDLKYSVENEYARLKIGDIIISDINKIETYIYKMVTSQGKKRHQAIKIQLNKYIDNLNKALDVLSKGGVVVRTKRLNLIHQEEVKQEIYFKQTADKNQYLLEIIELRPRIKQIENIIKKVSLLIDQRDQSLNDKNSDDYLLLTNQTKKYIQSISPIINRMVENSNRLFFEGQVRLKDIENSIIKQKTFYNVMQFTLSFLIMLTVLIFGYIILRQVKSSNDQLNHLAEELNFQIFALNQHAIVSSTDVKGEINYVNKRFCEISGYSEEELIGENHRKIKSNEHPPELFEDMWDTISSGNVWQGEVKNTTKSGGFYWVSASIVPFLDRAGHPFKYISIRTDITKRKAMEFEINKSRRFLQGLTDAMGEGVYALDKKGLCIFINPETEHLTGWSKEELMGQNIHNLIHFQTNKGTHVPASECPTYKSIKQGKTYKSDNEFFTNKEGILFPVSIISVPLYEDNEIVGSVAIFQDITQRKKNETELLNAKVQAELASQEKSNFLANMSHEIRTPMNAIIGMSYLALQTNLNTEQENYINKVHFSAESLLRIINDILDFSKIEAGKMDIEHIHFELSSVLENIEVVLEDKIKTKPIQLIFETDDTIPNYLIGDPLRLSQILINLSNNAIKFTESGQVVVKTVLEKKLAENSVRIHFSVQDTGIGMTDEHQVALFKPFRQADSSTTRKYGGTGLGLSISKKLVQLLDGEIWVESKHKIGSTFHFTSQFDISEKELSNAEEGLSITYQNSLEQLEGVNILLVEDNLLNQELAIDLLQKNNINVTCAQNGKEAIELLELTEIDGILMDMQMPILDGYEATKMIRKNSKYAHLPIIAMTASNMTGDNEKALNAGLNDHISKPINIRNMFITMAKWINLSNKPDANNKKIRVNNNIKIISSLTTHYPILDTNDALLRVGQDKDIYIQILTTFLSHHTNDISDIKTAIQNKQWAIAKRTAHTLKGVSGNVGALSLEKILFDLDKLLSNDECDIDLNNSLFEESEKLLVQTIEAINDYCLHYEQGHSLNDEQIHPRQDINQALFFSQLEELRELVHGYDSNSAHFLSEIIAQGVSNDYKQKILELKQLINNYDFETAEGHISKFISKYKES